MSVGGRVKSDIRPGNFNFDGDKAKVVHALKALYVMRFMLGSKVQQ